jgi:hypothetical protein
MNDETTINLFVFWHYHDGTIQTVLGSRADKMRSDGRCRTTSYGGMWVTPVRLLPVDAGEEILAAVKAEEERMNETIAAARANAKARIQASLADTKAAR